jgi:hypothetical protein
VATPTESSSLQQGGYTTAKVGAEEAYEPRRGYLGGHGNFTTGSLSLLAMALKAQDKYEEAEAIDQQALGLREQGTTPGILRVAVVLHPPLIDPTDDSPGTIGRPL